MRFASQQSTCLFWLTVVIVIFYLWAFRSRRKALESFAQRELLDTLIYSLDRRKRKIKIYLISVIMILCLFSLMRPQWGFHWEEIRRKGLDILIAIDTSKSMLAEDVVPNRLERSKLAVKDLVKKLKGDRIGLIAFAGNAFLQCPLTIDYNGFLLSLDALSVNTIPRGGTSISSAIREAIRSYEGGQKKYKVLVIITDGEDHEDNPVEAAEEAKREGIKIFCIGIGTKEGELIPMLDENGNRIFLKDRLGNVVKTRLDEATLQKIALTTGGSYVRARGAKFGLDLIYKERISKMEKRQYESRMRKRYEERFQIPLTLAIMCLFLEYFIRMREGLI